MQDTHTSAVTARKSFRHISIKTTIMICATIKITLLNGNFSLRNGLSPTIFNSKHGELSSRLVIGIFARPLNPHTQTTICNKLKF